MQMTNEPPTNPDALAIYDSMVLAIDRCYQVDEVKDLRDRAMAFEHYARQALNVDAERKAIEVRIRAERRAGQLLKEMDRSPRGGDHKSTTFQNQTVQHEQIDSEIDVEVPVPKGEKPSPYQKAKKEANISDTQAHRWQKLAELPRETFEGKLQDPLVRPTTASLINSNGTKANAPKLPEEPELRQAPDDALWLWGQLRDFETDGYLKMDVNAIVAKMSAALQSDVRRLAPIIREWLGELQEEI